MIYYHIKIKAYFLVVGFDEYRLLGSDRINYLDPNNLIEVFTEMEIDKGIKLASVLNKLDPPVKKGGWYAYQ